MSTHKHRATRLVVCGGDEDDRLERWPRQFEAWIYVPGLAPGIFLDTVIQTAVKMTCSATRQPSLN